MALFAECDGCKRIGHPDLIKDWRTLSVDRGYPECTVEHGSADEVIELLLCSECDDLLDHQKLILAVRTAVSREKAAG